MIQRIQSIWLLAAAAAAFACLSVSLYAGNMAVADPRPSAWHELNGMEDRLTLFLTSAVSVLSLLALFVFKNRRLQIRLTVAALFTELILLGVFLLKIKSFVNGAFTIGAILHIGILVVLILAAVGIRKDMNLLKESESLR